MNCCTIASSWPEGGCGGAEAEALPGARNVNAGDGDTKLMQRCQPGPGPAAAAAATAATTCDRAAHRTKAIRNVNVNASLHPRTARPAPLSNYLYLPDWAQKQLSLQVMRATTQNQSRNPTARHRCSLSGSSSSSCAMCVGTCWSAPITT